LSLEITRARRKIAEKIWGGRTPDEVLSKRFKIFVLIAIFLIVISKPLYASGVTFPNFELITVTIVVVGSFSLYCGPTKFWRRVTRYFGAIVLAAIFTIDIAVWGFHSIYLFTWTGFLSIWVWAMRNKLSMFDNLKKLLWRTTVTAAAAIIIFDIYTGIIGWSLLGGAGLLTAFLGQIPFTLYHLCSLIFVPPLVGLGKLMVKVKVPVPVAIAAERRIGVQEGIR